MRNSRRTIAAAATFAICVAIASLSGAEEATKPKKKPKAKDQTTEQVAAPKPAIAVPPPEVLLILVRNTVVALNQANFTGNYTVLRDLGSPSLQVTSAADLGIAFADLRRQGVDLSPALLLSPSLSEQPGIAADGVLKLVGHFPTKPLQINFAMTFQPIGGVWRLHGLSVNTAQVQ